MNLHEFYIHEIVISWNNIKMLKVCQIYFIIVLIMNFSLFWKFIKYSQIKKEMIRSI